MNVLRFELSPFEEPETNLFRELSGLKFFGHGLLIGSWPMVVYTKHFTLMYGFATGDIDFAVTGAMRIPSAPCETIPELMERLGYSSLQDYSGIETYLCEGFEVEFITHRRGGRALQQWCSRHGRFPLSRYHSSTCFSSGDTISHQSIPHMGNGMQRD